MGFSDTANTIIGSGLGIIGILLFSTSQGLLITASFDVVQDPLLQNDTAQLERLTIKNTGWAQGKNVEAHIVSADQLHLITSFSTCPEGDIQTTFPNKTAIIKFQKFSTHVDCALGFESSRDGLISYIAVTGDNAPGYQWKIEDKKSFIFDISTILSIILGLLGIIFAVATFIAVERKARKTEYMQKLFTYVERERHIRESQRTRDFSSKTAVK